MGRFKSILMSPFSCIIFFAVMILVHCPFTNCSNRIVLNSQPLNFDKLFPQSPLQVVLESCMRIQHELLWQSTRDRIGEADAEQLVDLVVGRLYHVRSCTLEVVTSMYAVHEEDLTYLFSLLETIVESYQKLMEKVLPAHGKHALALLSEIKASLETLLR